MPPKTSKLERKQKIESASDLQKNHRQPHQHARSMSFLAAKMLLIGGNTNAA
jgi:hypothetical protein